MKSYEQTLYNVKSILIGIVETIKQIEYFEPTVVLVTIITATLTNNYYSYVKNKRNTQHVQDFVGLFS